MVCGRPRAKPLLVAGRQQCSAVTKWHLSARPTELVVEVCDRDVSHVGTLNARGGNECAGPKRILTLLRFPSAADMYVLTPPRRSFPHHTPAALSSPLGGWRLSLC